MAKDPAFLFYPGDWLGGTMGMSFEIKGCYIELLIYQFNNGRFTESEAKQVLSICFDSAWPMLKRKFNFDGQYYENTRLSIEIDKRKKFSESRRANALRKKRDVKDDEAYAKHMENENENENIIMDIHLKLKEEIFLKNDQEQKRFDLMKTELLNSESWIENIARLEQISVVEVKKYLNEFLQLTRVNEKFRESLKEVKSYFANWIRSERRKQKTNGTAKPKYELNANVPML